MNRRKRSRGSAAAGKRGGAGSLPVLATKLHIPPARPNLVSRPRLVALLAQGLENSLILLSAPAGFGKTTLVSEWLGTNPCAAGWLSLDRGDNDPVRFLTCLIAALQTIEPDLGESAQALLRTSPPPPMESVLTVLINDLASRGTRAILVLDDYHAIDSPAVHSSLAFFIDHAPTGVHVVIATRVDPPIPLARLRAQGKLLELRADTLRFTLEETTDFLNQRMTLGLSASDVKSLAARTEGWIVGLQMAALSLKGRSDASAFVHAVSGSQRYILDYLVEEVLGVQPDDIQAFLLQTCVLERLCGPLCEALLTEQNRIPSHRAGQTFLEDLEKANLFVIPLDGERTWYRYHHLFADLLRSRLLRSYGEKHVQNLHARAAAWLEENGLRAEAIEHALRAQDTARACRLIEEIAGDAWLGGEFYQVLHWIEAVPARLVRERPWLCVWSAWSRLQAGMVQGVEESIDDAERAAGAGAERDEALGEQIAALRVTCAGLRQDTGTTIELASRALQRPAAGKQAASLLARSNVLNVLGFAYYVRGELSPAEQAYGEARRLARESGFLLRELLVTHKLANIHRISGRLLEAYRLYQEALGCLRATGKDSFFAAGYLYCGLSHLLYEWNRFDEAGQMIAQSLRLNEIAQVPHLIIDTCQAQARLLLAQGDVDGAHGALQEAARLIQKHYCWPEVVSANQCCQVTVWLAKGDVGSAARWAEDCSPAGSESSDFLRETIRIARARVLLAQGLPDEAVSLLGLLAGAAEAGGRTGHLVEILALLAMGRATIRARRQERDTARPELDALKRSLVLARPQGYLRLFVDEGPPMAALLQQAAARGIEPDYVHKLLSAFAGRKTDEAPMGAHPSPGPGCGPSSPLEPLSERELEVLRLVAEGLSNRDIAQRLFVAVGTVKAHVHSICGKLDVENRTQAILRAQRLALLQPLSRRDYTLG